MAPLEVIGAGLSHTCSSSFRDALNMLGYAPSRILVLYLYVYSHAVFIDTTHSMEWNFWIT